MCLRLFLFGLFRNDTYLLPAHVRRMAVSSNERDTSRMEEEETHTHIALMLVHARKNHNRAMWRGMGGGWLS